jgi:hypothetical protein
MSEALKLKTRIRVDVYRNDLLPAGFEEWPEWLRAKWYAENAGDAVFEEKGNVALIEGANAIWGLVCAKAGTAFSNASARCGVGDGDTVASADQTDLQGTNTKFKAMLPTYPVYGTLGQAVFKSEFTSGEANFHWREYTLDNGGSALQNLNRRVADHGVKASGETRTLTITITIS